MIVICPTCKSELGVKGEARAANLYADLQAQLGEAVAQERERCAKVAEEFDDWVLCSCHDCRISAGSHAVKISASMEKLGSEIRK